MEFWSRIIRGGTPQKKPPPNPNNPQVRLAQFKRAYSNLLQIWNNGEIVSTDVFVAENVRLCLHRISELLNADQRGPTPHLCVTLAASNRLLAFVAKIAAAFESDVITHEALGVCSLLIDSEEEAFLEDRGFADQLPDFIESIQATVRRTTDTEIESSMVELMFGIAAKLRVEPHVLRVWFRPEKPEEDDEELSDSERRTRFEEFPLFYLLLRYVPAEGRAGEFARMGLLYIIETTAHSQDLEQWIVGGDMSALMASGLGALYSQLGRKLAMSYHKEEAPSILTFSAKSDQEPSADAEPTTSEEYQTHLSTFLASLVFWQDLLEHCSSTDVKQTLLDHFQYLFLQQLLYPSLLESSDVDGGSAVAVLTYLRLILSSIDHPDLVRLTIRYLFGKEDKVTEPVDSTKPISKIRRRKSASLIARLAAAEEDKPSPELFNLTDLIISSIRSKSQETVTATLYLLSAMLKRTNHQSLPGLLKTRPLRFEAERRTFGGQVKEVENLLNLAEGLAAFQDLEASYEKHIYDNRNILETHPCSMDLLGLDVKKNEDEESKTSNLEYRVIIVDDPVLKGIVVLVENFFKNDIETNLALTQSIIDLASCGYTSLEGWLLTSPSKYQYPDDDPLSAKSPDRPSLPSDEETKIHKINLSRREPTWKPSDSSPIYKALLSLLAESEKYQRELPEFESLLAETKTTIEGVDADIASAQATSFRESLDSGRTSPTKVMNTPQPVGSIAGRLKSDRAYGGDSAAGSPRGRPVDLSPTPTMVGRLSHLQLSPTTSPDGSSRNYSPSPLGAKDLQSPTPPKMSKSTRKVSEALTKSVRIVSGESAASDESKDENVSDVEGSGSDASSVLSEVDPYTKQSGSEEIPLGQLLTNVIILQEFVLELSALIETRGALFGEIKYL